MSEITHIGELRQDPDNARAHSARGVGMIEEALNEVGAARSIVIDEVGTILAGNATIEAAAAAGIERVRVVDADGEEIIAVRRSGLSDEQKKRLALYDNRAGELSDWDAEVLADLKQQDEALLAGLFRDDELDMLLAGIGEPPIPPAEARATLAERFGVPPFSVLDARQGYWQERKRAWIALGIQSELGRGGNLGDLSASVVGIPEGPERDACSKRRRELPGRSMLERERERVTKMAMHNDPMQRKRRYEATPEHTVKT